MLPTELNRFVWQLHLFFCICGTDISLDLFNAELFKPLNEGYDGQQDDKSLKFTCFWRTFCKPVQLLVLICLCRTAGKPWRRNNFRFSYSDSNFCIFMRL